MDTLIFDIIRGKTTGFGVNARGGKAKVQMAEVELPATFC